MLFQFNVGLNPIPQCVFSVTCFEMMKIGGLIGPKAFIEVLFNICCQFYLRGHFHLTLIRGPLFHKFDKCELK